jgi:hypothetical protein
MNPEYIILNKRRSGGWCEVEEWAKINSNDRTKKKKHTTKNQLFLERRLVVTETKFEGPF